MDNPLSKINRSASIIQQADIQPGMTVLDAGCGPGRVTIPLAKKVGPQGKVVALDLQAEMLRKVETKAQATNLGNITFLQADLSTEKLGSNRFDHAVLVSVLGEIPNQKAALEVLYTALKPGASLTITEIVFDPHYQRLNSVLELAKSVGFEKKKLFSDWFAYTLVLDRPAAQ